MGREEQKEEREVLDSIFPDEITDISDVEYKVSILLDIANNDGDMTQPPTILLHVKYPDAYPDEAPILDLSSPPNIRSHPYLEVASVKGQLLYSLSETIEENMGMAMIFTLVSTLKDLAEQLIAKRQATARDEHEQIVLAAEREENKKFHGTAVTPETFRAWRLQFRKEMEDLRVREEEAEEAAEKKKSRGKETVVGLTGRQLWERGMAGKAEEAYEDDDEGMPTSRLQKMKV
ncbi:MAG: hypothetical protein M1818_005442 [Claussenomyces sp. TS43310]|nr:MAG: hypothetical protein M1818_005442 [Claussenomyces sp. TS43310]